VQIKISTRHGHLGEEIRERITTKLERLTKYFDRLTSIELTVDLEHKDSPSVDLRVEAEHKHDFVANDESGDLSASVDGAIRKLEQQIRKYKQRVQNHHRTPGLRQQVSETSEETDAE